MKTALVIVALLISNVLSKDCMTSPSDKACSDYTYPPSNTSVDLDTLCSSKASMIGCSLRTMCQQKEVSGPYCDEFSLLGDICHVDQFNHPSCTSYNSMCSSGTQVQQCFSSPPAAHILNTEETKSKISMMCGMMSMAGCSSCDTTHCPNPLQTVSNLCLSMGGMSGCKDWTQFCSSAKAKGLENDMEMICGTTGVSDMPMMQMYFHTGFEEYILFKHWIPRNTLQYTFSWIAVFVSGVITIFLKASRQRAHEVFLKEQYRPLIPKLDRTSSIDLNVRHFLPSKKQLGQNTVRMAFSLLILTMEYALMLVAMTFNVGLFFAVVTGLSFGTLLFGHAVPSTLESCCD